MKNERTLTELRNGLKGKIYIYIANSKVCKKFLENAEQEGFRFGKIKPTDSDGADIIALENRKQLSYVGFVGHMAFGCPSGVKGEFYRVDYNKFINGDKDFLIESRNKFQMTEIKGKFYANVTIIGDKYSEAAQYIKDGIETCETEDDELKLYDLASDMFDVIILEE